MVLPVVDEQTLDFGRYRQVGMPLLELDCKIMYDCAIIIEEIHGNASFVLLLSGSDIAHYNHAFKL